MSADSRSELQRNAILRGLPANELEQLLERLEIISVELKDTVYVPDEPISFLYFPLNAVFSFVATVDEEAAVEVGTTGAEGFVGLPVFLGTSTSPHRAFCQIPGKAARITPAGLQQVLKNDGILHRRLHRFTQATIVQLAQNVACNRMHSTEARASRWLLMTHDRVGADQFPLTQEFLGQMLGVRRPTVSLTAATLQSAGLIRYSRGNVTILDRPGLEAASCDCYRVIRDEFDRLERPEPSPGTG